MSLYVSNRCPHSKTALSMLARAPTVVRNRIRINEIDWSNAPPAVTRVPVLIKQDGTMLRGRALFDHLNQLQRNPDVTPMFETFGAASQNVVPIVVVIIIILGLCWWSKRSV